MDDKKETFIVKIDEDYSAIGDSCNSTVENNRKPEGLVEVYEKTEDGELKLVRKSNLVVYQGREIIAMRLVGVNNAFITASEDDAIYWLGLGSGGATVGDPLTPIPPTNLDTDLDTEVPLHETDTVNCTDYRNSAYNKHALDSVVFEQDASNDSKYLIAKITTTIGTDDALNNVGGSDYSINEAGLFASDSDTAGIGNTGPFSLFARVTFPSIVKTNTRELIFVWYIYT